MARRIRVALPDAGNFFDYGAPGEPHRRDFYNAAVFKFNCTWTFYDRARASLAFSGLPLQLSLLLLSLALSSSFSLSLSYFLSPSFSRNRRAGLQAMVICKDGNDPRRYTNISCEGCRLHNPSRGIGGSNYLGTVPHCASTFCRACARQGYAID